MCFYLLYIEFAKKLFLCGCALHRKGVCFYRPQYIAQRQSNNVGRDMYPATSLSRIPRHVSYVFLFSESVIYTIGRRLIAQKLCLWSSFKVFGLSKHKELFLLQSQPNHFSPSRFFPDINPKNARRMPVLSLWSWTGSNVIPKHTHVRRPWQRWAGILTLLPTS